SNWEKTLGTDPAGAPGERARQDVFLLRLNPAGGEPELRLTPQGIRRGPGLLTRPARNQPRPRIERP
ncbi:MAG TPA: hypothetical protein VH138_09240, partial [Vicinamibacterales bacterium]|nr:hypothetical protein [Vicinamibacterales bacterium]